MRTWEAIGRSAMIPSLRGIGKFRGKLVNLCGRLTQISMNVNGTSIEEYFEIINFIEDNAPFTMLLGKTWIERDQAKKKEEEKVLEQQKQELTNFMTRRITQLIEEQENKLKLFDTQSLDVKVARALEDSQKIAIFVSNIEEVLPLSLKRES
jgi:predicted phage tail protein